MTDGSNTTPDQPKKRPGGATGKGFVKGDPRINRKGRPKSFDALRELAREIAHEEAKSGGVPIVINGHIVTVAEAILRQMVQSRNSRDQQYFLEIAFGKVPDKVEVNVAWEDEIVALLKSGRLSPDDVRIAFPVNLVRSFFARAGIAIDVNADNAD